MKRGSDTSIVSILSLRFPEGFPKHACVDELPGMVGAINFPTYSQSELSKIAGRASSGKDFKTTLDGMKYYFPLVPVILQYIADCDDFSADVLDYCACVVLCSYISWRVFAEFTLNFEYTGLILNALPYVSLSPKHSALVMKVYNEIVLYYLRDSPIFSFPMILASMKRLYACNPSKISEIGSLFEPLLLRYENESKISREDATAFVEFLIEIENPELKLITKLNNVLGDTE